MCGQPLRSEKFAHGIDVREQSNTGCKELALNENGYSMKIQYIQTHETNH